MRTTVEQMFEHCPYMEVGPGWWPLLRDLCIKLERIETTRRIHVSQVKEKFGGLRFYFHGDSAYGQAIEDAVISAERQALVTCEECGAPGRTRDGGWYRTLCDNHSGGRKPLKQYRGDEL